MKTAALVLSLAALAVIAGCTTDVQNQGDWRKAEAAFGLGSLCSGDKACDEYCHRESLACEAYCVEHRDNAMCQQRFSFVYEPGYTPRTLPQETTTTTGAVSTTTTTFPPSCRGNGAVTFTSPPMQLNNLWYIVPLGQMGGSHVTPTDHGYYIGLGSKPGIDDKNIYRDVLAPADGIVEDINTVAGADDYRITLRHTCSFYTIYIHVKELSPRLLQATNGKTYSTPNLPVSAGEPIGRAGGFDFSVHDENVNLTGFVVPAHYNEEWKIHTVDMFASFAEPIRTQLLAKNIRQAEPRSGKIDYDIDGKLVGNWFVEGTGGYGDGGPAFASRTGGYWTTHLAFAYNNLDPTLVIVSIGNYPSRFGQFAVKGNAPDPATVRVSTGLVKYELVGFEYRTENGQWWDRTSFAKIAKAEEVGQVEGVVLVQMTEDRKIKFEAFPGKTAAEVPGFSSPTIYER